MSEKKTLNEKELSKVTGGESEKKMIEIYYDIACSGCDYVGHMSYEEGTEEGSKNFVDAVCPVCGTKNKIGLGIA